MTDELADGLPVRRLPPERFAEPVPTVVYVHGGGWFRATSTRTTRSCAASSATPVPVFVSVGYRLAPEHPWPAAPRDAVRRSAGSPTGSGVRRLRGLAVAGDSAGGNLAAIATQDLRGEVDIAAQLLLYPATDLLSAPPVEGRVRARLTC